MAWLGSDRNTSAADKARRPSFGAPAIRAIAMLAFAVATAFVVACGHQVTPEPNLALSSDLSGKVVVRYDTVAPLSFSSFYYAIVINACGSGIVPYPNVYGTTFLNYSYVFFVGGGTSGTAQVILYQYYFNNTITPLSVPINPSLIQFNPNSNGLGTEFELVFSRSLLNDPLHIAEPCPNVTQPPFSPTPTVTGTATPTAGPTSAPTTGATATPFPYATTAAQQSWIFNFITFSAVNGSIGVPQDSLGIGGPTDTTFPGIVINTSQFSQMPIFRQAPLQQLSNQSAQLEGGEIDNYP